MTNSTLPYEERAAETFPHPAAKTAFTAGLDYEVVKPYLSNKPLRRPARAQSASANEDRLDVEAARAALAEPGSISLEQFTRELGL